MYKNIGLGLLFCVAVVMTFRTVSPWFTRSGAALESDVTYICLETKEVVRAPAQQEPALNSQTGKRTLVRAVYSPQAQKWVPSPPEEVLRAQRQAFLSAGGASPQRFAPSDKKEATP